jgi:hypothetical protein
MRIGVSPMFIAQHQRDTDAAGGRIGGAVIQWQQGWGAG